MKTITTKKAIIKKPIIKKSTVKRVAKQKILTNTSNNKTTGARKRKVSRKKVFIEIPEDKFFVLINGDKIKHYVELADKLEHIEQHVLNHHITPYKHDFANWVKDVFDEKDLADKLAKINEPEKIRLLIYKHIVKKYLK